LPTAEQGLDYKIHFRGFSRQIKCDLMGRHNFAIFGNDLSKKYGESAKPDRICLRCDKKEIWFSQFQGRDIYQDQKTQELNF
jgi:hypothetical protein